MSHKNKEYLSSQTPEAQAWLTSKPADGREFAEVVVRVQTADDSGASQVWTEYLVAPAADVHAASVELLKLAAAQKKKTAAPATPKTTAIRQFFSPAGSGKEKGRASSRASVTLKAPVFGVPLADVMARERELDPSAVLPRCVRDGILMVLRRGLWVEGIFRLSGAKNEVDQLRAEYDHGALDHDPLTSVKDVNVVASVLKLFLREMPEPLLPAKDYDAYIRAVQLDNSKSTVAQLKKLLAAVSETNLQLLSAYVKMLNCVVRNAKWNKMSASNCAIVLGPNILRRVETSESLHASAMMAMDTADVNRVAEFLITHPEITLPAQESESKYGRFETKLVGHAKSVLSVIDLGTCMCSMDSSGAGNLWSPDETLAHVGTFELGWRPLGAVAGNGKCWVFGTAGLDVRSAAGSQLYHKVQPFFCAAAVDKKMWLGTDKSIVVLDGDTYEEHGRISFDCELVFCLLWLPRHDEVWAGGLDNSIKIFSVTTGALKDTIPNAHKKRIMHMCATLDFAGVYSASEDGSLALWSIARRAKERTVQAHETKCNGVCVAHDNVFTCGWDTTLRVFTNSTLEPVHVFQGYHDDAVYSLTMAGDRVWAAGGDRSVSLWSVAPPK